MTEREAPVLDLTLDGEFRRRPGVPWARRAGFVALLIAAGVAAFVVALLAFWLAVLMIPIAVFAGLVGYGLLRFHLWRLRH